MRLHCALEIGALNFYFVSIWRQTFQVFSGGTHLFDTTAGANTIVRKSIVDKNARIGSNVQIVNKAGVMEANRENEGWVIKDGITIIIKDSTIPDGTII